MSGWQDSGVLTPVEWRGYLRSNSTRLNTADSQPTACTRCTAANKRPFEDGQFKHSLPLRNPRM